MIKFKYMKKTIAIFAVILFTAFASFGQTSSKEIKVGRIFYITLPAYMTKTVGLNDAAAIQFKNTIKDVYGFVVEDTKEEMKMVEISFATINEFYDNFIKDFLKDEEKRKVSAIDTKKKGEINFVESDVTYYDKNSKSDICYFVGIAETKTSFYKVLTWCALENKAKYKADFQKMLYSIRD